MTINELISELNQYDGEREIHVQDNGMGYVNEVCGVMEKHTRQFWGNDGNEVMLIIGDQIGMAD